MKRIKQADAKRLFTKAVKSAVGEYDMSDATARAASAALVFWDELDERPNRAGRKSAEKRNEKRGERLDLLADALRRLHERFPMRERFKLDDIWTEARIERIGRFTYAQIEQRDLERRVKELSARAEDPR